MADFNGFNADFAGPAQFAEVYRKIHWQVVPSYPPKRGTSWKRPMLPQWTMFQRELVSDEVWNWWYGPGGQFATHENMGIITGACSDNTFVVDLDTHKDSRAEAWWRGILAEHNSRLEPETVEQVTGGGGRQLMFRAPPGYRVPTRKTGIGVDIRGDGGFAVTAPSLHESGRHYAWCPGRAPWEIEVELAPAWLLEEIEALVDAHGGDETDLRQGPRSASPETPLNEFGSAIDDRESIMRDVVWRAVLELYRQGKTKPQEAFLEIECEHAYTVYEGRVANRRPELGKTEGLEADGRGPSAFRRKWAREMRHWGSPKMVLAAAKPAPEGLHLGGSAEGSKYNPQGDASGTGQSEQPAPIPVRSAFPIDERKIPTRDWVVPGLLLRRTVSLLVAPPGSGKSLFTLQAAIMIAALVQWGGWLPRSSEKVLVINAEDDADEMDRRLVLAAREMGVEQSALAGRVLMVDAPESIIIAKVDGRSKVVVRTPLIEELVETVKVNGIGVIVVDPFAETFVGNENDNSEVKWALVLWREIARRTGASLLLVHHTKKYAGGMAGDADAARGGGSIIGVVRILMTLFGMTEDEAMAMDVADSERGNYVRFDDGKANYSKKGDPRWFEKQSHTLNNGNGIIPGDDVAVLVPWKPPGALDGVTMHDIGLALDAIDRGLLDENGASSGRFYTLSNTSSNKDRWAGKVLERILGCSEKAAKDLLKKWHAENVLEVFDYTCPMTRRMKTGVRSILNNRPGRVIND